MSLRAFHLLFIGLSVALAAFCAAWAVEQYRAAPGAGYAATAASSLIAATGLAWYGTLFQKKTRSL